MNFHEMGVRVMISIWPTVDRTSVNYEEMSERDLLIRTDRGLKCYNGMLGNAVLH